MDNIEITARALADLRQGNPISDDHLVIAILTLEPTIQLLRALGDRFYLARKELMSAQDSMREIQDARKGR